MFWRRSYQVRDTISRWKLQKSSECHSKTYGFEESSTESLVHKELPLVWVREEVDTSALFLHTCMQRLKENNHYFPSCKDWNYFSLPLKRNRMLFDRRRKKKTWHLTWARALMLGQESEGGGGGRGARRRGPAKGARLFNCCQFPLKAIHHKDWVKQSHQHTEGLLPSMLVCVCRHGHRVVHHTSNS